jgi:UDP-4-amino-4,6-dideoxy-N-acetyl-beta-L-altrosamine transaminase
MKGYLPSEFLSYGKHWISDSDVEAVVRTLRSDRLTQGPAVEEFEQAIALAVGSRYCVAVANGTAALHLSVAALRIPPGHSGITSPITFAASANCMAYCGLRPAFADIDEETACVDPLELERHIDDSTKLLIPVHFAGVPANMSRIGTLARMNGLRVIEDAAHALGSRYADGSQVGSCSNSDLTVFSFHAVKTITTGEGGAITTNDAGLYERLLLLRTHGITRIPRLLEKNPGPWYYEMHALGYNYRLTDIQAALGTSQIARLEFLVSRRREIAKRYDKAFSRLAWIRRGNEPEGVYSAYHLYVVRFDFGAIGKDRAAVMAELQSKEIGTQVHYIPVHLQPYYRDAWGYSPGEFPKAERFYSSALSLPLYPKMSDDDVGYVISAVQALAK